MKLWVKKNKIILGYIIVWTIFCLFELNRFYHMYFSEIQVDVWTMFDYVYTNSNIYLLQVVGSIIVMAPVTYELFQKHYTGMLQYSLTRQSYRQFMWRDFFGISKYFFMIPIGILILFLLCCVICDFNFVVPSVTQSGIMTDVGSTIAMYKDRLPIYAILVLLVPMLCSVFWGLLAMICVKKFRNYFTSLGVAYVIDYTFIMVLSVAYEKVGIDYLSIYYLFQDPIVWISSPSVGSPYSYLLFFSILIITTSMICWWMYRDKESTVIASEK